MRDELQQIGIRLPPDLVREAKLDAVSNDETLQDWFKDAAEMKLRERGRASTSRSRELSNQSV